MTLPAALLPATLGFILLVVLAVPVFLSRNKTIVSRWITWCAIATLSYGAQLAGAAGTVALAILVSVLCAVEFGKLVKLRAFDLSLLLLTCVAFPVLAATQDAWLFKYLPYILIAGAVLPLFSSDLPSSAKRSVFTAFGILWLAWATSRMVPLHAHLTLVVLVVAVTDVASWAAGKSLGRLPLLRTRPFVVSPNKTIAGLLGGAGAAAVCLVLVGSFSLELFLIVALGAPMGDLLASAFKRGAGVKDTGSWLPGFGGLLDRADSLLLVLPLAALVLK
ncbi:MAG: putative CDP-diglyceride synthetase/phosphatidate cytidylyltransferase [Glaciihabitans sp.]|jgi:phosphatidate cytidylyltransferase|nr:putative CDP-diglyceride synthetase/phosphatidate cytidylyltransferase [Glaciihabitans sp.]MDQ1556710.1 phosphatidate cytidylyltransferase [Actinomycetota bacterium]